MIALFSRITTRRPLRRLSIFVIGAWLGLLGMLAGVVTAWAAPAAAACSANNVTGCATSFATPVLTVLQVLVPLAIAIGLVVRGIEHKESPKSIAIDVLIGAILSEIVLVVIKALAGA